MNSCFAFSGMTNRFLALVAHGGEVLFDTQKNAPCARLCGGTVFLDLRSTGFAHRGDLHECRLARLAEIIEMRLNAFGEWFRSPLASRTKLHDVPSARLYD